MTPSMIFGILIGAVTTKYMPTRALQIFSAGRFAAPNRARAMA